MFGKLTADRQRKDLLAEARDNADKFRRNALVSAHQAAHLSVKARHESEMAQHYEETVVRLSSERTITELITTAGSDRWHEVRDEEGADQRADERREEQGS